MTRDKYANFSELLEHEREGQDYERVIQARAAEVVILAPHGGGIECGTSEVAKALAGDVFSLYCFEGVKLTGNKYLHITSTRFTDSACLELVGTHATAIAIHGCGGEEAAVYVGGRNERLKQSILQSLHAGGFTAFEANDRHPGTHPRNICNLGREGGVQLELTTGLRQQMFRGMSRAERKFTTPVFDAFVEAVREGTKGAEGAKGTEETEGLGGL